jgi:hypothetical protein
MIRIQVPGFYGFTNNKILAVSLFSTIIFLFSNISLHFLNDNNENYNIYDFYDFNIFLRTFKYSFNIMLFFYLFDNFLDNTFWNMNIFGIKESYVDESEIAISNRFILRPMNSHSSIFLIFVGLYSYFQINENTQYLYACYFFSLSQILMGFISYLWWASNVHFIHIIDNLLMEQIVNSISILIWTTIFPSFEIFFIFLSVLYFILHFLNFEKERLFELCILFILGSFISTYYSGNGEHLYFSIGTFLTLGGLVPKITDRAIRFQLGTSIFHFMEAFGFLFFYKWVQTIYVN